MKKRISLLCIIASIISIFILNCKNDTFDKYLDARKKKIASDATSPDTTPPDVYDVLSTSHTTIKITFSEKLDEDTAQEKSNYIIQNSTRSIEVLEAFLLEDEISVILNVTEGMEHNADYLMVIKNVEDLKKNAIDISLTPFKGRGAVFVYLSNTPDNPTTSQSIDIIVSGSDIVSYKYRLDDSGNMSDEIEISNHIQISEIPEGPHTLYIFGKDSLNNWQPITNATTLTWTIDLTPPTATLNNLPDNPTNSPDTSIIVSGPQVVQYKYKIDGSDWSFPISISNPIAERNLSEGEHTIDVIGRDQAGNWQKEIVPSSYTWTIDTSAPTATLSNLPPDPTNQREIDIVVSGTEVVSYKYRIDQGQWSIEKPNNIHITKSGLSENSHTIEVIGKDNAGNWQSENNATVYTWEIDTSAATAILSSLPAPNTNIQTADIDVGGEDVQAYKFKLDDGDWNILEIDESLNISLTEFELPEGKHTIYVIARDSAFNWQSELNATTYTWIIDITPPTAILTNKPSNPTNFQNTNINVSGEQVLFYKYRLDGNTWSDERSANTAIVETGLPAGSHTIEVIGRDQAGNWQEGNNSTIYTWTVDITPPIALFNTTPDNPSNNPNPVFGVTGDGVVLYRYRVDNSQWSGLYDVSTPITLSKITDGQHTIEIIGSDLAGNEQEEQDATFFTWTIDLLAPTAEISSMPSSPTNDQKIDATVGGTDVIAYMYKIDNGPWSAEMPVATTISMPNLPEGLRSIYIVGKDKAGNWQAFTDATVYTWEIDITPPTIALANTPVNPTNQRTISIQITGADVVSYKYKLDSEEWSSFEIDKSINIVESDLSQGDHTLLVIGKDAAGNWQDVSKATGFSWFIDLSAPTAVISNTPSNPTNVQDVDINVSGTDVVAYSYNIDNSGWSSEVDATTNIIASGLPEGIHILQVVAKDYAQNWQDEENATTYSWKIDLTPPTALLSNKPNNPTNKQNTNITVGGEDVIFYKYQIDGTGWSNELSITEAIVLNLDIGKHTIEVVALDPAGNWQDYTNATSYTWEIDKAPPAVPVVSDTGDFDPDQELYFYWNNTPDITEVRIQIATDFDFLNIVLGGTEGKPIDTSENYTYYMDPNDGPTYYARIKVSDSSDNWSDWGIPSDGISVAGSLSGKILDTTLTEISGATIELKKTSDNSTVETSSADSNGNFSFSHVPIGNLAYYIEVSAPGYYSATKNNITSNAGINTDIGIIYLVSTTATAGTISGTIVDANDGAYVNGATIEIYDWTGIVVDSQTAPGNSFTTIQLTPGTYTIIISKTGYFDLTIDNTIVDGNVDIGRLALCEVLTEPQVRVIVQWGTTPYDLDLHVVGPTDYAYTGDVWWDGNPINRFHVYWQNHKSYDENTGFYSRDGDPDGYSSTTSLVQDDTTSWGPEAINLFGYGSSYDYGIYTFTVHQYRENILQTWYDYPVTMRVFDSQGLVQEIPVPNGAVVGQEDTDFFWKAIKINIQGASRDKRTLIIENTFGQYYYSTKSDLNW